MRRRLVIAVVGTVAAALTFAAILTFALLDRDARQSERRNLAEAAARVAQRASSVRSLDTVGQALELDAAAQLSVVIDPGSGPDPEIGNSFGEVPPEVVTDATGPVALTRLLQDRTVSGITADQAWAAAPVRRFGPRLEAVLLSRALPDTATRTIGFIAIASAAALGLAALAAIVIARGLARPLREATAAYRRIAAGDLSVRASRSERDRQRADEVGELTRALDTMTSALERARDQERSFLLSVSHDLRTPLTSIRGYAEAIAEGTATDQHRAAEVIASESRRLERLVRDLLELARLEADQFSLSMRDTDVTDLVTDAADGFLPTAARAGVELVLDAEDGIRAVTDPERLMQMIANLTENAIKFARTRVTVRLTRVPGADGSDAAFMIGIGDDGPGIDAADLPRVFERSYTSDRRAPRQAGSGLGLAIVRELATAMHGRVEISTGEAGTELRLILPMGA
jgi:two-component system sensor histidine kinase BaeS